MNMKWNRRRFIGAGLAASTGAMAFRFEERALAAQAQSAAPAPTAQADPSKMPRGRIGRLSISRMICGGNLISGFAHSRDLIYVSRLLKEYFTDAKVCDTLESCERHGIDTAILRLDENTLRILKAYRRDRGGKIQWIAQVRVSEQDVDSEIQEAIDNGAAAVFVHGGVGDYWAQRGRPEILARSIDLIRKNGVVAGIAGHMIEVPMMCEKEGLKPDFYMKTFNAKNYWSAGPQERHDSVWEETPEQTKAFMEKVRIPWIAYKVLGAGAIHPRQGFDYAFRHGADFICAGMFDFQIAENAGILEQAVARNQERARPWLG